MAAGRAALRRVFGPGGRGIASTPRVGSFIINIYRGALPEHRRYTANRQIVPELKHSLFQRLHFGHRWGVSKARSWGQAKISLHFYGQCYGNRAKVAPVAAQTLI